METFFIINDEMKIWRKNKGMLILQQYINKYKPFKMFFFFYGCARKNLETTQELNHKVWKKNEYKKMYFEEQFYYQTSS